MSPDTRSQAQDVTAPPSTTSRLRDEAARLLALADAIEAAQPKAERGFLQHWRGQVRAWLANPKLETLAGERALDALALDLRYRWLTQAHGLSGRYLMSPPHSQTKALPGRETIGYPYDRWLKPEHLEDRLRAHRDTPAGWRQDALLFASGMAALSTLLHHVRGAGAKTLHWWGGYFEIARLLHLACDTRFQGRRHAQQQSLCDTVRAGHGDLFLIEPVAADFPLEVFDQDAFAAAWRARPGIAQGGRPAMIVIDTSLTGDAYPIAELCARLGPHPPVAVVQVASGLKLDQQGLELANAGLVNVYVPDAEDAAKRLARLSENLKIARTTFGAGLSQDEYAALSAPFFLDRTSLRDHGARVFANAATFARALAPCAKPGGGGLITEVVHPALAPKDARPWARAPFVNLRYAADGADARHILRAVLEFEAQRRGFTFVSGSSFGFRGHRFEMGVAKPVRHDTLRVAPGSRAGPALDGVIGLFKDLSAFEDFARLRAAYPDIVAATPKARAAEDA